MTRRALAVRFNAVTPLPPAPPTARGVGGEALADEPLPPDGVAEAAQREPSGVLWRIIDRRPYEGPVLPATER